MDLHFFLAFNYYFFLEPFCMVFSFTIQYFMFPIKINLHDFFIFNTSNEMICNASFIG